MRVTEKEYETAKKALERAKKHQETVKDWEKAVKNFGELNGKKILSMNFDGEKVTYEVVDHEQGE